MSPLLGSTLVFFGGLAVLCALALWMLAVKHWLIRALLVVMLGVMLNSFLTLGTYSYLNGTCAPLFKPSGRGCPDKPQI